MSDLDDEELNATKTLYQEDADTKLSKINFKKNKISKNKEIFKRGHCFNRCIIKIDYSNNIIYLHGNFSTNELSIILQKAKEFRIKCI